MAAMYKYGTLGTSSEEPESSQRLSALKTTSAVIMLLVLTAWAGFAIPSIFASPTAFATRSTSCDRVYDGYQCDSDVSHYWGQYSPYFSVPSNISDELPAQCQITFAQILSRHGARDPTASKTKSYNATIQKIHASVKNFTGPYAFLAGYEYTLGADQLTVFGQQEMVNSGIKFRSRYRGLAKHYTPFVRSSGEARVVESAQNWTQGFGDISTSILVIPEGDGVNNTLNHDLCTAFENGSDSNIASSAQAIWADIFIPPIQARLNGALSGANLTVSDAINMMDLCPFNTVASSSGAVSSFCALFTEQEWRKYDYYETLGKYYGYSYGNPLGAAQGVGWANELIARLTSEPVHEGASTNSTLDEDNATFPLGRHLYADFSHDNDMTAIFSALGLYNGTTALPNTTIVEASQSAGYSASWTVPFAARAYFEKMQCQGHHEELVRIIINDRVLPLTQCGGDSLGRCSLNSFIDSLGFAKMDGNWDQCFV